MRSVPAAGFFPLPRVPPAVRPWGFSQYLDAISRRIPESMMLASRRIGAAFVVSFVSLAVAGANEAQALPPPIHKAGRALEQAWKTSAPAVDECSARARAGDRAGTIWVDVLFSSSGTPKWKLRRSPGLSATDASCIDRVVSRHLLPALKGTYEAVEEPIETKELSLGAATRFLPPLHSFLAAWFDLLRSRSDASRARLQERVKPLASVAPDSCLLIRREERLQRSQREWLAAAGREVPRLWQAVVVESAKPLNISDPGLFAVDGGLLFTGARTDAKVTYQVQQEGGQQRAQPPDWSRQWDTYCLRRLDARLRADLDRGIDEIATCVSGSATERLVDPRIESPSDRKLHSVSLAENRYCGVDQAGAIVCCGVRAGVVPQGTFTAVSVDEQYGCALRSGGDVACWGNAPLGARPPEGRFTKLHVAGGACALTDRGSLRCWGLADAYQPPPGEFVDVAVAYNSAYAVAADGTLVEWGRRSERRPAGAARVAANSCEVCVTTRTGAVDCRDENGQATHFAGPTVGFAPGCPSGCGLSADGAIVCAPEPPAAPPPAIAAQRYSEIASIRDRFCATSRGGHVACWGAPWPGNRLGRRPLTGEPR